MEDISLFENKFQNGPPTLICCMRHHHLTNEVLAEETNTDAEYVSAVLSGDAVITPQFADALEKIFGLPWSFWMGIDTKFDEAAQRYLRDPSSYLR